MGVGIDPQVVEPTFNLRRHIRVPHLDRAIYQCQQHHPFDKLEERDCEQSSVATPVRSLLDSHRSVSNRPFTGRWPYEELVANEIRLSSPPRHMRHRHAHGKRP